jgi:hypothetical protein
MEEERCALCGCILNRTQGQYATPTITGRSHATKHHFVASRFFRSKKRQNPIFEDCPWPTDGKKADKFMDVFCYECHEEILHNPVFLPEDIANYSKLVKKRGLNEDNKNESRDKVAGRIKLLHEIIQTGLNTLLERNEKW